MTAFTFFRGNPAHLGVWVVVLANLCVTSSSMLSTLGTRNLGMMAESSPPIASVAKPTTPPLNRYNIRFKVPKEIHSSKTLHKSLFGGEAEDEDSRKTKEEKVISMKMRSLGDKNLVGLWQLTQDEELFLGHRLERLVKNEMPHCALLLAHDLPYRHSRLLRRLLLLPNPKQVWIDLN